MTGVIVDQRGRRPSEPRERVLRELRVWGTRADVGRSRKDHRWSGRWEGASVSVVGTFRTWLDVRVESVMRGKADIG